MSEKKLIGMDANQVPTNGMLGTMAFQEFNAVNIIGGKILSSTLSGVLSESLIPTISSAGRISDSALSSNVFLKTSAQTLTNKLIFATPTVSASSLNLPHGTAPTSPLDGDVWTATTGLFVRVNGRTEQIAELGANTFQDKQSFVAPTVSAASINLPHGTAPTGAVNGDLWTTTSGVFVRVNGATEQLADLSANTFTAKQSLPASTASAAPINLGEGVAPTSPVNGDIWATSGGIFSQSNGVPYRLNNQVRELRVITGSGLVTALSTDEIIMINRTTSTSAVLMAVPEVGKILYFKDGFGNAATYNITINGNGKTIEGQVTYVISSNYGWVTLVYNGTQWVRLS